MTESLKVVVLGFAVGIDELKKTAQNIKILVQV